MRGTHKPRVSIGVPVYNGEDYLAETLDSILAENFRDFEVIISDNCSTDRTPAIAQHYAKRDARLRYYRTSHNLGAAPNFNRTFWLSRGDYFRWAAHDDLTDPQFLQRCVRILDSHPDVVLCHSKVRIIDGKSRPIGDYVYLPKTNSSRPSTRFGHLLVVRNHCYEVFGLIRSRVLHRTAGMGAFPVGDRVLLAELALAGRFFEIDDYLFFSRDHENRSVRQLVSQRERAPWFDTRYQGKITLPECRQFYEYCKVVQRARVSPVEKALCCAYIAQFLRRYRKLMRGDVINAAQMLSRHLRQAAQSEPLSEAIHRDFPAIARA